MTKTTVFTLQAGFPLYFGMEIQGLFKDFQGPWSCIFKDQFSTEVYCMDSIKAIFNIYFCDYGTVLVDKNKTWQLLANLVLGKTPV